MFGPGCNVPIGGYNVCTGVDLYLVVIALVALIVVTDLLFALVDLSRGPLPPRRLRRVLVRMFSQSLEEYFWDWTRNHPFSALVLAFMVGAAISHFFWAVASPA